MFELNRELESWRKRFSRESRLQGDELEELESHLLELHEALIQSGHSDHEAFALAIKRLGEPAEIKAEYAKCRVTSSERLWRAFWIAPLVAPVLLAVDMFVVGLLLSDSGDSGTPLGVLTVPLIALTLGIFGAYLITLSCWMPVVFFLRKRDWLNGGSIHLMGLLLALAVIAILEFAACCVPAVLRDNFFGLSGPSLYLSGFMIPNVMLSALVFWLMIRDSAETVGEIQQGEGQVL